LSDPTVDIRAVLTKYAAAASAGDDSATTQLFWPNAVIAGIAPDSQGQEQFTSLSVPDFVRWMASERANYVRLEFRILQAQIACYENLAEVRAVWEIRERRRGGREEVSRSLDAFHLLRHRGQWRMVAHTWTMESASSPLTGWRPTRPSSDC
jgi:ketosteroid isomerase-like protein